MGKLQPVTRVVFRRWYRKQDGTGVIALFPDLHERPYGTVSSYEHHGQHGSADYAGVVSRTHLAAPEEYASLKRELESYPFNYNLRVVKRAWAGPGNKTGDTGASAREEAN